jgi:hypothetical protein
MLNLINEDIVIILFFIIIIFYLKVLDLASDDNKTVFALKALMFLSVGAKAYPKLNGNLMLIFLLTTCYG